MLIKKINEMGRIPLATLMLLLLLSAGITPTKVCEKLGGNHGSPEGG